MMRVCLPMTCWKIANDQAYTLDSGCLVGSALLTLMGGARSLLYRTEGLILIFDVTLSAMLKRHVHMTQMPRQQSLLIGDVLLTRKIYE